MHRTTESRNGPRFNKWLAKQPQPPGSAPQATRGFGVGVQRGRDELTHSSQQATPAFVVKSSLPATPSSGFGSGRNTARAVDGVPKSLPPTSPRRQLPAGSVRRPQLKRSEQSSDSVDEDVADLLQQLSKKDSSVSTVGGSSIADLDTQKRQKIDADGRRRSSGTSKHKSSKVELGEETFDLSVESAKSKQPGVVVTSSETTTPPPDPLAVSAVPTLPDIESTHPNVQGMSPETADQYKALNSSREDKKNLSGSVNGGSNTLIEAISVPSHRLSSVSNNFNATAGSMTSRPYTSQSGFNTTANQQRGHSPPQSKPIPKDPLAELRWCIRCFINRPDVYGPVPQLLMQTYTSILGHAATDDGGDDHRPGNDGGGVVKPHEGNFFEQLNGEAGLLGDLRELQTANGRLKKAVHTLQQQIDMLRIQLREKELDLAKGEKMQGMAEQAEADQRAKYQNAQLQYNTCHSDLMQAKAQQLKLMQQLQHNQTADETRLAERTADLRAELARLYDNVRNNEELIKSYDRETAILRADMEDLETKHSALNRELDSAMETISHKDDEIVQLSNTIHQRDETISKMDATIMDLKLEAGHLMVQEAMIKGNGAWKHVKDVEQNRRALEMSSGSVAGSKMIKGFGMGADIPVHLKFQGKLKPKTLSRADVQQIMISCVEETTDQTNTLKCALDEMKPNYIFMNMERMMGSESAASSSTRPFAEQLKWWLVKKCGEKVKPGVELAYGLKNTLQAALDTKKGGLAGASHRRATIFSDASTPMNASISRRKTLKSVAQDDLAREQSASLGSNSAASAALHQQQQPGTLFNDLEMLFYQKIIDGVLPPTAMVFVLHRLQQLRDLLMAEDLRLHPDELRDALPITAVHRVLHEFATHPAHHAEKDELSRLKFLLSMDHNTPYIPYLKLFEVDEAGAMPFALRCVLELLVASVMSYYDDLEGIVEYLAQKKLQAEREAAKALDASEDMSPKTAKLRRKKKSTTGGELTPPVVSHRNSAVSRGATPLTLTPNTLSLDPHPPRKLSTSVNKDTSEGGNVVNTQRDDDADNGDGPPAQSEDADKPTEYDPHHVTVSIHDFTHQLLLLDPGRVLDIESIEECMKKELITDKITANVGGAAKEALLKQQGTKDDVTVSDLTKFIRMYLWLRVSTTATLNPGFNEARNPVALMSLSATPGPSSISNSPAKAPALGGSGAVARSNSDGAPASTTSNPLFANPEGNDQDHDPLFVFLKKRTATVGSTTNEPNQQQAANGTSSHSPNAHAPKPYITTFHFPIRRPFALKDALEHSMAMEASATEGSGLNGSFTLAGSFRIARERSVAKAIISSLIRRQASALPVGFQQRQRSQSFAAFPKIDEVPASAVTFAQ